MHGVGVRDELPVVTDDEPEGVVLPFAEALELVLSHRGVLLVQRRPVVERRDRCGIGLVEALDALDLRRVLAQAGSQWKSPVKRPSTIPIW